jgi:hypothetical protein
MILVTDGYANQSSGCFSPPTDLVPDLPGFPADWNAARECAAWRAQQATAEGITIHTISIGDGADQALMAFVADLSGGIHLHVSTSDDLSEAFDILDTEPVLHAPNHPFAIFRRQSPTDTWKIHPPRLTHPDTLELVITGTNVARLSSQWALAAIPEPVVHQIALTPITPTLPADGVSQSWIIADFEDLSDSGPSYPPTIITFTASLGSVDPITSVAISEVGTLLWFTTGQEAGRALIVAHTPHSVGATEIILEPLAPAAATLQASPTIIPADGVSTAALAATVLDMYGNLVKDGTVVTFTSSLGAITPYTATTGGGVAVGTLTAGLDPGDAVITITVGDLQETVRIQIGHRFYLPLLLFEETFQ